MPAKARFYLGLFGMLAFTMGVIVETNVLGALGNQRLLAAVAIIGGLAMLIVAVFDIGSSGKGDG